MRWLRVLYVANGLAYGVFIAFLSVYLRARGFEDAVVGITSSLGSLFYMLALPAWGHVGDVLAGPRRAIQIATLPAAVVAVAFDAPVPAVGLIAINVVLAMLGGPIGALTDAMGVATLEDPSREYARFRLLTSLGAAAGAIGSGLLFDSVGGYWPAPLLYAAVSLLIFVAAQFTHAGRESDRSRRREAPAMVPTTLPEPAGRFGSISEALAGRPRFALTLLSVLLIYIGVMVGGTFLSLRIADLGGGATEIGVATSLSSIAEVPGLVLGGYIAARFGLRRLLAGAGLVFAAATASWGVLGDPGAIALSRLVAGCSFGAFTFAFVLGISQQLPDRLQSTGQTLYQATAFGAAAVIANLVGGFVKEGLGSFVLFGGGGLLVVVGAVIGFAALRRPAPRATEEPLPVPEPA